MKIDRAKLKKSSSELPEACKQLIDRLSAANDDAAVYEIINEVRSWEYGKSELYHWVDILDRFDDIMSRSCQYVDGNKWRLVCDQPENTQLKLLMLQVVRFTSLLIEHSFQRHSYESMDHLITLLSSSDMTVVLEVLNVLYVFSKRSNFFTRLSPSRKKEVVVRLHYLAESWGGKENGFGLAECCQSLPLDQYPSSATTVHFEFYTNKNSKTLPNTLCAIHLENVDKMSDNAADIMTQVLAEYDVPENKHMLLFTHIRLANRFSDYKQRTNCILARLQAISILVYSHAIDNEEAHQFIYNGFINELVNVLELPSDEYTEMKAAVLRTLTAIIHLERNPKLESIIDITGAYTYHGFLPSLVRKCIVHMVEPGMTPFPHAFSTALFSFLYHLASYESGGDALLSCGIMPSLLRLAAWHSDELEHITFVTRAVRIIDLMTNMCTQSFETHHGLKVFVDRLEHEVTICRDEQPFVIRPQRLTSLASVDSVAMDVSESSNNDGISIADSLYNQPGTSASCMQYEQLPTGLQCLPQRSALLKSVLNFFKKAIPDPTPSFAETIRHIMEGSLPKSLQHVISNAEYYGATLFLLALEVVTVFVFQEPSLLSSLQDKGLTEVVLSSLLVKNVPATREVLAALPNVFSALCLNQRGLDAFVEYKPFDKLFKVLLTPEYLPAMRKRKSSDQFGDTATNLGTAMDELMRHQPSLKSDAIKAIIGLLREIIRLGEDSSYVCSSKVTDISTDSTNSSAAGQTASPNSDIESEDDEDGPSSSSVRPSIPVSVSVPELVGDSKSVTPKAIPLMDYILNVMKFIDAIMGNTSDDHCTEFISQGGLEPLFSVLQLRNLPIDFPSSTAFQSVSSICTVCLKLTHDNKVLEEGLKQLEKVLQKVSKLYEREEAAGSILLSELANAVSDTVSINDALNCTAATPLLHYLTAINSYVKVFVHMCRFGQADLKQKSIKEWGSDRGLSVISQLGKLQFSLVWEGTILLALCSDSDLLPSDSNFGRSEYAKLVPKGSSAQRDMDTDSNSSVTVSTAMEALSTMDVGTGFLGLDEDTSDSILGDSSKKSASAIPMQGKQLKPLFNVTSRLGSSLTELFHNILVRICNGSLMLRQRRGGTAQPTLPTQAPTAESRAIAKAICKIVVDALNIKSSSADVHKLNVSFLTCVLGFTVPVLFEDHQAFHLMLQEFGNLSGFTSFFDVFTSTMNHLSDNSLFSKLPEYAVEFLDAWLLLAEKLLHPKCVLETIYLLSSKKDQPETSSFNATEHLKVMQKPVFDAVMRLWGQQVLSKAKETDSNNVELLEQVAASTLSILCDILQSDKIIKEKEGAKAKPPPTSGQGAPPALSEGAALIPVSAPADSLAVENPTLLRDLMDMGFSRERCLEALNFSTSLAEATDYILTHPSTADGGMDLSEDEQIRAAIQLSLTTAIEQTEKKDEPKPSLPETTKSEPTASTSVEKPASNLLTTDDISKLKESLFAGCMTMLDSMPNTVFKVCKLLVVIAGRDGAMWKQDMFKQLLNQISDLSNNLTKASYTLAWGETQQDAVQFFTKDAVSVQLASRMHLLTLLIQELEAQCVSGIQESDVITQVLNMISSCLSGLRHAGTSGTPPWLASVMLIIDQCEKSALASQRKIDAKRIMGESTSWKWFDDRNGRWCAYNNSSNAVIDAAYKSGESSVRFTAGRRKYLVKFNAMIQLNEETGNRRPVMLAIPSKDERDTRKQQMETEMNFSPTLQTSQMANLVRCCVDLISIPVESDTLHAVLRLCLRITRKHNMAELFVEYGGIDSLIRLTQESAFTGFTSLCTLLIRHVLEDDLALRLCFDKVVREIAEGVGSNICGVSSQSMGCREINFVMRNLGPAMCRNPDMLKSVAKEAMKIQLQNGKEPSWFIQHQIDLIVTEPEKPLPVNPPGERFRQIIGSLLNILISPYTKDKSDEPLEEENATAAVVIGPTYSSVVTGARAISYQERLQRIESKTKLADDKRDDEAQKSADSKKPLVSKSAVLRMLSEFIKSYTCCANIVVQHVFVPSPNTCITEEFSALSYIFDRLLPTNQEDGDRDCPSLSRLLLASIASCNHSQESQTILVTELKSALQRTLALPEIANKYSHIQTLASLVSIIIDACPSGTQTKPPLIYKSITTQTMNQIVKLMVKKGFVSELARVPHSLDLSNPSAVATINSLLKPLETLSRIVNQPQFAPSILNKSLRPSETIASTQTLGSPLVGDGAAPASEGDNPLPAADTGVADALIVTGTVAPGNPADSGTEHRQSANNEGATSADEDNVADMDDIEESHYDIVDNEDDLMSNDASMTVIPGDAVISVDVNISLPDEVDEQNLLSNVQAQVEVLEQALDEILSQGRSDHSAAEELDRVEAEENDFDARRRDDDEAHQNAIDLMAPYHEDEEDDTTSDEDDDEDDDDDDDDEADGDGNQNQDGGELGIDDDDDDDDGWSDDEDMDDGARIASLLGLDDDNELFSRLEAYDGSAMDSIFSRPRILVADQPLPLNNQDMDNNNNEDLVQPLPAAPNPVPLIHPLMNPSLTESSRPQRSYIPSLSRLSRRAGNRPERTTLDRVSGVSVIQSPQNTILQRLFGPNVAANILQLTTRLGNTNTARLYISDDDSLRFVSRNDDDAYDMQDGIERMKSTSGSGILSSVPTTMNRWIEECRVLDSHSIHDVVTVIKTEIIDQLNVKKKAELDSASAKEKDTKEGKEEAVASASQSSTTVTNPLASIASTRLPLPESVRQIAMDSDDDSERSLRSRSLLSSVEALFGAADGLAQDVARLYNRQQELRSLISRTQEQTAPRPAATSAYSTRGDLRSALRAEITSALNTSANNIQTTASSQENPTSASNVESSTQPATSSSDGDRGQGEAAGEADRACSPPHILFDADQPAPPVDANQLPDEPISATHLSDILRSIVANPSTTVVEPTLQHTAEVSLVTDLAAMAAASTGDMVSLANNQAPIIGSSADTQQAAAASVTGFEGVDPSFLEALPESIRREVIADQLRLARIQNQVRQTTTLSVGTSASSQAPPTNVVADVSPEFLAALPPNIQEEVLAVQRAEQSRQQATQSGPDSSHDPGVFLSSLPLSLRQQVLADMDDSQLAVLPSDLMAEAQLLRGEYEDRTRRLQDQLFSGNTLGSILRGGLTGGTRLSASRFLRRGLGGNTTTTGSSGAGSGWTTTPITAGLRGASKNIIRRGRQLLDTEGLTCLLVLLFLDEPRLNVSRLHRILKNLAYHSDTLTWIIRALISILNKTTLEKCTKSSNENLSGKQMTSQSVWLSFGMDAALGCRANVFQMHHNIGSKKNSSGSLQGSQSSSVSIHPQAAQLVSQHVLDALIFLSKSFPNQFLLVKEGDGFGESQKDKDIGSSVRPKSAKPPSGSSQSFWDVLIRLDQMKLTKKGKGIQKQSSTTLSVADDSTGSSIEDSPLGQLLSLLSTRVIKRSPSLTDKLLKLLGIVSQAVSDLVKYPSMSQATTTASSNILEQSKLTFDKNKVLLPDQLKLAVQVLTSKSCSEEGLEDCTKFLVRMAGATETTKLYIVRLLLEGAQQIGTTVNNHISSLEKEAVDYNNQQITSSSAGQLLDDTTGEVPPHDDSVTNLLAFTQSPSYSGRGMVADRFQQGSLVTIAPPKNKRTHELQLPSMSLLTAKSSSQQFLLRLLKVIIQLGDNKKLSTTGESGAANSMASATSANTDPTPQAPAVQQSMDVDGASITRSSEQMSHDANITKADDTLSQQLQLDLLWDALGRCLVQLSQSTDPNAVLVLQPAVEAFFLVHAGQRVSQNRRSRRDARNQEDQLSHLNVEEQPPSPAGPTSVVSEGQLKPTLISADTKKFLEFAETHRTVLNQILRQSQTALSDDGPFSVLIDHMKLLDFDVKLRYFRAELQKLDEGSRREDLAVHVRRDHVFEDSYRELFRRSADEWKHRLYIVFEGEEGQDAGGLLREWYVIMSREIFNPNYALFMTTPQDRVTYTINPLSYYNSEHLSYFKFVGRIIAKAIYDNKLLECYFTRSFYKHITGQSVRYTDMEAEDYSFYQGLEFLLTHNVNDLGYDLTFSTEIQEFGVTQTRDLKPGGANTLVTEDNKKEYVKLVCQLKMTGAIHKQLNAFLEGFYDVIPKYLISIFNEQELELLISGLPTIDIDDLKANTDYHKYTANSLQIIWFWRALRSFDQAERARFLQFVTGTSKVPLQGFAFLEGMNGIQKFQVHRDDRSTDRLPCAHTCFNQLDLPAYETYDKLKKNLLLVINECSEGFGLA